MSNSRATPMHPGSIIALQASDNGYPSALRHYLGSAAPHQVSALGNLDVLRCRLLALLCSARCPGNLILQTYDLMQTLRQAGVTVISGFHAPMERECLTVLLRGTQPIVVCPARNIVGMQMRSEYQAPLAAGRLLFLSPFTKAQRRVTAETAMARNRFVAALADAIFVPHAAPHSKTEQFCHDILTWGKPLYTLEADANTGLITLGAQELRPNTAEATLRTTARHRQE